MMSDRASEFHHRVVTCSSAVKTSGHYRRRQISAVSSSSACPRFDQFLSQNWLRFIFISSQPFVDASTRPPPLTVHLDECVQVCLRVGTSRASVFVEFALLRRGSNRASVDILETVGLFTSITYIFLNFISLLAAARLQCLRHSRFI